MSKQILIEYSLRPATIDDIDFIFQLRVKTMKQYFKDTIGWNDTEERKKATDELNHARIVMVEGKEIGVIKVIPKADELNLHQMQILPEFQNKGLGAKLLQQIIIRSENLKIPITLFVVNNTPAKRLYEKFGFVITDEYEYNCRMYRELELNKDK